MAPSLARCSVVFALLGALVAGCGSDDDPADLTTGSSPPAPAAAWERLPDSPLSPRSTSVAVGVGDEMIVVGGATWTCPPTADCAAPADPPLGDGAAVDLTTGEWRTISSPPFPFADASTAVIDDTVYFSTATPDTGERALLEYDVDGDSWSRLPSPDQERALSNGALVVAGDQLVMPQSDDHVGVADLLFDPATATWSELPVDPLTPADHREMIWSGDRLYLFAQEFPQSEDAEREAPLTRAARLDLGSGEWEQLPDSSMQGLGPFLVEGSLIVDPTMVASPEMSESSAGWVFDTGTATWSALPPGPGDAGSAGAIGEEHAVYTGTSGVLLDTTTMAWTDLPPLDPENDAENRDGSFSNPPEGPTTERSVVTAGADAFVFGGVAWEGSDDFDGEVLGDAWIWRSGRQPGAAPTTPASSLDPTTTGPGATTPSSSGTTGAGPTPEPTTTAPGPVEPVELTRFGGCADAYFWAANADGTVALTVYVDVQDRPSNQPTVLGLALPDPVATVTLERGSDLTQSFCNDVLDQDYELDEEVPVAKGSVYLTVDPIPEEPGGFVNGTLTLVGLVAEDGTPIEDLEITTDMIGMYAG